MQVSPPHLDSWPRLISPLFPLHCTSINCLDSGAGRRADREMVIVPYDCVRSSRALIGGGGGGRWGSVVAFSRRQEGGEEK